MFCILRNGRLNIQSMFTLTLLIKEIVVLIIQLRRCGRQILLERIGISRLFLEMKVRRWRLE